MKKIFIFVLLMSTLSFSQVAIGTATPSSAAVLYLSTANFATINRGGFIMPVVTEAEQALIPVIAVDDGMQVFVSDSSTGKWCWDVYDGQANVWRSINCAPVPVCSTLLFLEDFNGYSVKTGRERRVDSGDYPVANWIIDDSGADFLLQDNDHAYTNAAGEFELNNTDGPISITFAAVDISAYLTACFSVDIRGEGDEEYDPAQHSTDDSNNINDYVNVEYSIDGGAWVMITNFGGNGTGDHTLVAPPLANGTFPDSTVTETGLAGSSLRVRITSSTWASDEYFFYDNFRIEGGN